MKVLIAEDDTATALLVRRGLEKLGHEATVARDGEEAWELLERQAQQQQQRQRGSGGSGSSSSAEGFRVLITDWMMPRLDGPALCRRVREREKDSDVPYLYTMLLTVRGSDEDRLAGLSAGADDFLVKPLSSGDLLARLEVAQKVLALQEDVRTRSRQVERLEVRLERQGGEAGSARIGDLLVSKGIITAEQLKLALKQQSRTGSRLGSILVANGWATDEDITRARAKQVDMPYVNIAEEMLDPYALSLIPGEMARRLQALPMGTDDKLTLSDPETAPLRIALSDPWNVQAIDQIQTLTKRRVTVCLASESALSQTIERVFRGSGQAAAASTDVHSVIETLDEFAGVTLEGLFNEAEDSDDAEALMAQSEQAPVVRLINTLIADAVRRRASDIHLEPYQKDWEIRYRIDGELHVIRTLPRRLLAPSTSRIKVMADMDITERRVPQDGRIAVRIEGKPIDLRVSTLPTQFGERTVLRVLDRDSATIPLEKLSLSPVNSRSYEKLIRRPHGIILVTGPTGSGKTTTLYATLNALKSPATNILTCEDPIEYQLDRIGQSAVNPRAGLTFARQLRAILRQDPDVVLVGEIRDAETAEIAFQAALTGHLVLSTLHCNEAAGAPSRLMDMGVEPFLIASALSGVVAQRLARRLCPHCRREDANGAEQLPLILSDPQERAEWANATFYEPVGCEQCDRHGTRGRFGIHEIMTVDDTMRQMMLSRADTAALRRAARSAGMVSMLHDGIEKASQGMTTLTEVQRKVMTE